MGLDMYLTAEQFFWTNDKKSVERINKLFPEMKRNKLKYVIYEIGYWRKANHIHNWFVKNVQEGEDNCGEYSVSRDDYYFEKCEDTIKIINKALKLPKVWEFSYHSSW